MKLRDALINQAPSLALQREAHAEILRLDAEIEAMTEKANMYCHRAAVFATQRDDLQSKMRTPLTDAEITRAAALTLGHEIVGACDLSELRAFGREIELAHGIEKPGSVLDLRGCLARPDVPAVPVEAMRIGRCVCGPDGCADSECPGRCGGAK